MNEPATGLSFEERGIARALGERVLRVPLNQRSYAWEDDEVRTLFGDLYRAFMSNDPIFFMGALVFTKSQSRDWEVADGQQRLATISILIASIRDMLIEVGDTRGAEKFQTQYLLDYDVREKDHRPKFYLNFQDHSFFLETILKAPAERKVYAGQRFASHSLLSRAAALAREHVENVLAAVPANEKAERLYDYIDFLGDSAKVIIIMVAGSVGNAFKMFETLNARGMKAGQTDILKNFLFGLGRERISDMNSRWISMVATVEGSGEDDLMIKFIRHYWISQYGPTTERDLGESIERHVKSERQANDLVNALSSSASDYVALLYPRDHPRWNPYRPETRDCIFTLSRELGVEQIRPLMLAVARSFSLGEADRAFAMMVSWSVRFLIVGGGGGGVLDRNYGIRAQEISRHDYSTASDLRDRMLSVVPTDSVFIKAFSVATVRKTNLARYYLRALERQHLGERFPQMLPNLDTRAVNLEHVLPVTPSDDWQIRPEDAALYHKRLGNMTLMSSKDNVTAANEVFEHKKALLANSPFKLTAMIADEVEWSPDHIERRQDFLAQLAPRTWPL